mgnify:CR=1 FL=1
MSYTLLDYNATEVELNDGIRSYYYKKCYCSVELQGEYIVFTSHKVENNAFRQQWSIAYTDFTSPVGTANQVYLAIKAIIENYSGPSSNSVGYLYAYDNTGQYAMSPNVGYPMTFNNQTENNLIGWSTSSAFRISKEGVYNIQFSAQFANYDNKANDVDIWFVVNGANVSWSNSKFSILGTHGGVEGHQIAAWNFMSRFYANDEIEIYWQTNDTAVNIEVYGGTYGEPETPSIILSVNQIV